MLTVDFMYCKILQKIVILFPVIMETKAILELITCYEMV
jgi:hypothetical protein